MFAPKLQFYSVTKTKSEKKYSRCHHLGLNVRAVRVKWMKRGSLSNSHRPMGGLLSSDGGQAKRWFAVGKAVVYTQKVLIFCSNAVFSYLWSKL